MRKQKNNICGQPLQPGPRVPGHMIHQDQTQRVWIIDQRLLRCSPTEHGCFRLLLEHVDHLVSYAQLATQLPMLCSDNHMERALAKERLQHLMSHLREKVWPFGLDIANVRNEGYLLLSQPQEQTP